MELLVFDSNNWNHLTVSKPLQFKSANKLIPTHLKMKLPTNDSLTNNMYFHLNVCKQTTDVK